MLLIINRVCVFLLHFSFWSLSRRCAHGDIFSCVNWFIPRTGPDPLNRSHFSAIKTNRPASSICIANRFASATFFPFCFAVERGLRVRTLVYVTRFKFREASLGKGIFFGNLQRLCCSRSRSPFTLDSVRFLAKNAADHRRPVHFGDRLASTKSAPCLRLRCWRSWGIDAKESGFLRTRSAVAAAAKTEFLAFNSKPIKIK